MSAVARPGGWPQRFTSTMSLAAAPTRRKGIANRVVIASSSRTTRMKSSVGGFESPKGRFDVLFIEQVGSFDVAAIASCQEIGVCEYRDRKSTRLNSSHLGISYAV